SGVSVSNGREVVQTNAKGQYTLPAGNDDIIFVIKPAGYQVPLNEYNLPGFYYIQKPQGSPDLNYPGTAPTGRLPKSVEFALTPPSENEKFSILVFGEPQVTDLTEVGYFDKGIMDEVERERNQAVFGISLGDLAFNNLEVYEPYSKAISRAGVPWYNVM